MFRLYCLKSISFITIILSNKLAFCKENEAKIVIIGAGMTGVLAAKTLHESGEEDFVILEANTRVGGRMWNVPFGGQNVELGASYIHGIQNNPVYDRALEVDLQIQKTDDNSFTARDENANDVSLQFELTYARYIINLVRAHAYGRELQCNNTEKADTSLRRSLFQFGWDAKTDLEKAAEFMAGEIFFGRSLDDVSTRNFVDYHREDFGGGDWAVFDPRGYGFLAESFLSDVLEEDDDRLQLGTRVKSVSQNDTHVTLETSAGDIYTSQYVLSTVSLGVLQSDEIAWQPDFSQSKFEAIMQHKVGTFMTVYLKFPEDVPVFWDDSEFIIHVGNRRSHWVGFLNFNHFHNGSRILQAISTGDEARRVELLTNDEIQGEIMGVLKNMYGSDIPEPEGILAPRWNSMNNFRGSYANYPTAYTMNMVAELRKPQGRVHFAGEAMSSRYIGYIQGAYFDGIRGAEFLMECMNGGDCHVEVPNECD